ncbi:hypothetical protein HDV00_006427 [Rhizophlyctis rosea]|nr:hypothetical protein HDV00_006427 [Rhizophlyctis rosea]
MHVKSLKRPASAVWLPPSLPDDHSLPDVTRPSTIKIDKSLYDITNLTGNAMHQDHRHLLPEFMEELSELFPHGKEQFDVCEPILRRFEAWEDNVTGLMSFFQVLIALKDTIGCEFKKAAQHLSPIRMDLPEFAGVNGLLKPVHNLLAKMCEDQVSNAQWFDRRILWKLKLLKDHIEKETKAFVTQMTEHLNYANHHRYKVYLAIREHEKTSAKQASQTQHPTAARIDEAAGVYHPHGIRNATDPWLTSRYVQAHLATVVAYENAIQEKILEAMVAVARFDDYCVKDVKEILDVFCTLERDSIRKVDGTLIQGELKNANEILSSIHDDQPFQQFMQENKLDYNVFRKQHRDEDFPYKLHDIKLLKQGVLHRPGTIRHRNFKPTFAVVTETGYFHVFDCKLNTLTSQPATTVGGASSSTPQSGKIVLNGGELNLDAGKETHAPPSNLLADIHGQGRKKTKRGTKVRGVEEPAVKFSLNLASPLIKVEVDPIREFENVFQITVRTVPNAKRGLSKIFHKKGGEKVYEFKANGQEDLQEWVNVLNNTIRSFVPQSPPTPFPRASVSVPEVPASAVPLSAEAAGLHHKHRPLPTPPVTPPVNGTAIPVPPQPPAAPPVNGTTIPAQGQTPVNGFAIPAPPQPPISGTAIPAPPPPPISPAAAAIAAAEGDDVPLKRVLKEERVVVKEEVLPSNTDTEVGTGDVGGADVGGTDGV